MSDTVLEHPAVRDYLRVLNAACVSLPVAQARELREQVLAHLDEALPPGATYDEVVDELDRLGSPRMLAAAAAGPGPRPLWRRLRNRLGHVRWWVWAALAVLIPAFGTGAGFFISMESAAPLIASGAIGWLYPADQSRAVETTAGDVTQTAVPYRFGQRQGILVSLVNESDWTQRIVGVDPTWAFGTVPGETRVSVQSGPDLNVVGTALSGPTYYVLPGNIPPHSARLVRVFWTSNACMGAGGGMGIDSIRLLVRIGLVTRTENIPLQDAFELTGPKHSIDHNCG